MGFAFETPADPYGDVSESDIDTWWASKDRTTPHGWDDAHGYIMRDISSGIPAGHSLFESCTHILSHKIHIRLSVNV